MIDRPPSVAYLRRHWRTLVPHLIAAALRIALGVWEVRVLLSWAEGIPFLCSVLWAGPSLWHRLRRR